MDRAGENRKGPAPICRGRIHVIEKGDTLYGLARKYDVKLFDIMRLNPYVNVYNLQVGDELCIPVAPENSEPKYIVKENDTIANILKRTGESFETLANRNPFLWELKPEPGAEILLSPVPRSSETEENV